MSVDLAVCGPSARIMGTELCVWIVCSDDRAEVGRLLGSGDRALHAPTARAGIRRAAPRPPPTTTTNTNTNTQVRPRRVTLALARQVFDLSEALDQAGEWVRPLEITLVHRHSRTPPSPRPSTWSPGPPLVSRLPPPCLRCPHPRQSQSCPPWHRVNRGYGGGKRIVAVTVFFAVRPVT